MRWEKVKLGEYIDVLPGFAFKSKDFQKKGVPVIKIKNITSQGVNLDTDSCVSKEFMVTHKKYALRYDDILIAMTGSHINQWASVVGRVAKVKYHENSLLNQRVGKIVSKNEEHCCLDYVYYFLKQDSVVIELAGVAGGAANQANISPGNIKALKIPFPDIYMQRKIADILSLYDKFIENNQKQIKLLEEAAQRLYKEWFVDLRFPGHENTKIVDGVPERWSDNTINSVARIKAGGDKPKDFSERPSPEKQIPVYANGITEKGLMGYTSKAAINEPSVTISARGTVGVVFLRRTPYMPIVRLVSITPDLEKIDILYLYLYLLNQKFRSTGAAQQQITVPLLKDKHIICPTKEIQMAFNKAMVPIFDRIDAMEKQNIKLAESRDRLLPRLVSGEIEV